MATRSYMSIGEVLVALKAEFPDVTISKIRFLEGEHLIEPERTASGYRKFREEDLERLRTILKLQRDEYLPLKVIRERIETAEEGGALPAATAQVSPEDDLTGPPTGLQMSLEELSGATGVERDRIRELEQFGILSSHGSNGERFYDGDDFVVLSIARDLFRYGVEPRHLTMYKHFAQREASFFESIVMPVLRQRNPDARRVATQNLTDLVALSRKLKQAMLRANLRQYLQGP